MVVIGLDSGMGNQMFQYALGYALSHNKCVDLYIDLSFFSLNARPYALNHFNISAKEFSIPQLPSENTSYRVIWKVVKLFKLGMFKTLFIREDSKDYYKYRPEYFVTNKNMYINGFWQNYRYFDAYKNDLKNEFTIKNQKITKQMQKLIDEVQEVESVAIHIRKGDYSKCDGWMLSDDYYLRAIEQYYNKKVVFYVFCEDIECIKKIMEGTNYVVVSKNFNLDDVQEFWVMKSCKNHIISNSTYSWWAAYLADSGKTIAPVFKWWGNDFYPDDWTKIEVNS